jgi:hypothetical protein
MRGEEGTAKVVFTHLGRKERENAIVIIGSFSSFSMGEEGGTMEGIPSGHFWWGKPMGWWGNSWEVKDVTFDNLPHSRAGVHIRFYRSRSTYLQEQEVHLCRSRSTSL